MNLNSGEIHTPNANMADRSVVARNESHGSEASEASMFCFDRKVLLRRGSGLLYFAVPTSCCVFECHEKGYKSSTVHLVSLGKIVEKKERRSRSPWN